MIGSGPESRPPQAVEVKAMPAHKDYLPAIFARCVAAIAGSSLGVRNGCEQIDVDADALALLIELTELRMQSLFASLGKLSRVQRRLSPSIDDVACLLQLHNINICELEREKTRLAGAPLVSTLEGLEFSPEMEAVSDVEQVFFVRAKTEEAIKAIVPSTRKMHSYGPSWMPQLPPDHTFMKTAQYTNCVRDLRQLRDTIVYEGRQAERALQRLLGTSSASVLELLDADEAAKIHRQTFKVSDIPDFGQARNESLRSESGAQIVPSSASAVVAPSAETDEVIQLPAEPTSGEDRNGPNDTDENMPLAGPLPPNGGEQSNKSSLETSVEPSVEPGSDLGLSHVESQNASAGPEGDTNASATESQTKSVGTLKLKLPKLKLKAAAPVISAPAQKPLSLKISIGKTPRAHTGKSSRKSNLYGKRPRVDIEALAHKPRDVAETSLVGSESLNGGDQEMLDADDIELTHRNMTSAPTDVLSAIFNEALSGVD